MNETQFARSVCRHLDRSAEALPYRAQQRLAAARQAALDRLPATTAGSAVGFAALTPGRTQTAPALAVGRQRVEPDRSTSLWWRLAATVLPALLLVIGIVVADTIEEEQAVADLAEVDSALLTDDLPLVAYADHGFGVYLKNMRR
ncbi:MAG: DUF3619 family protein [Lautropia sp.]